MSKVKTLIERNLPFNQKYIYLEIVRGSIEDAQFCTCDNCGKLITNMVHIVEMSTKKKYVIGTDCAETLSQAKCLYNNGSQTDYRLDLYSYNKVARFVTELRKGAKMSVNGFGLCSVENSKGKVIDCYITDLKKYFPEYAA